MKVAIITGASSGLGYEYVKAVIERYPDINEYWLIARRAERLQAIAAEYSDKKIVPICLDLTKDGSFAEFEALLKEKEPEVRLLINNAGFGKLGRLADMPYGDQIRMVDLNNRALTGITNISLPYMKKGSYVLNVCSIAAFAPNPRMTVYCSTKDKLKAVMDVCKVGCIHCSKCVKACPAGAIHITNERVQIDQLTCLSCTDCGMACVHACPRKILRARG